MIVTIARNPVDSPNMTANDAAILESITAELMECGAEVLSIGENEELPNDTQLICSMSRTISTIKRLKEAEQKGITILNTPQSVENCSRRRFMEILHNNAIPQPPFNVLSSSVELQDSCFPSWIKKAKGWSCHRDDVCFSQTKEEAVAAIEQMSERGIDEYIQMLHITGDIIKFYGIGNDFFYHCYPGNTKFGKEEKNGVPKHYHFESNSLKGFAQKAAQAIGLTIYGGDAIITPQGEIFIIDINDFPSFTAIRDEAAKNIAKLIIGKTK